MDELPNPITRSEQYLAKIAGAEPTLPTPITREERYLAKIAGEDVDIPPAPITRTEQYLAAIVEGGGGGGVEVESLSVTENGTYTAEEGKAYSPVSVAVENSYAAGDEGKVVSNGALVAQTSDSVTENGTVDTTLINSLEVNVPQGSVEAPEKDVNFIDYDGTILYSYTANEFAALTELPALVSHDGMAAATAWNWTLADAKAYVATYGGLWIGQEYAKTEIDIELSYGALSPTLGIGINGSVTVDWGDGNSNVMTGSNEQNATEQQHTYANPGKYTISLTLATGTSVNIGRLNGTKTLLCNSTNTATNNIKYSSCIRAIRLSADVAIWVYAFWYCTQLKSISIPRNNSFLDTAVLRYCYMLKTVSFPKETTYFGQYALSNCYSLRDISMPVLTYYNSISGYNFSNCINLERVVIPANITALGNYAFNGCYGLREIVCLAETPPTVGSDALLIGSGDGLTIYVPYSEDHSVLNTYKSTSGWSTYKSRMVELPE